MAERGDRTTGDAPPSGGVHKRRRRASSRTPERGMEAVHAQWWQMVEDAPTPIFLMMADRGILLAANQRFQDLLEWPREALEGMPLSLIVPEEEWDPLGELVEEVLGEGAGTRHGAFLRRRDGRVLPCRLEGRLVLFRNWEAIQFCVQLLGVDRPPGISDKTATFFHDLSQIIPLLLDFDQILDRIVERFAQALEFHAFALSFVEDGELKRLTIYTAEDPLEDFLSEVQEHVLGALLHLGVRVHPTRLQHSVRERSWIHRGKAPRMGSELILPIPMGGARGVQGLGGLFHQGAHAFSAEETALFSTFVGGIASSYLVYHSYRQIEAQSNTDPLTGLANRRGLFKELEEMLRLARRERQAISLILVDVDHFKSINDRYGHKVGDEVLQQLAGYLRQGSREMDVVARFGGEEFLLLLPGVDAGAALEIAERIRSDVASLDMDVSEELRPKVPPGGIRVTLSLGIGSVQPGEAPDLVIRRVDEALYRAKGGGRNRVVTESWAEG